MVIPRACSSGACAVKDKTRVSGHDSSGLNFSVSENKAFQPLDM